MPNRRAPGALEVHTIVHVPKREALRRWGAKPLQVAPPELAA